MVCWAYRRQAVSAQVVSVFCDQAFHDRTLVTGDLVVSVHADFAPSPRAVGEARVLIASALSDGAGHALNRDLVIAAQLIASELVTNAVLHARTWLHLYIDRDEHTLLIAVADGAAPDGVPNLFDRTSTGSRNGESGRGLFIVSAIADACGWRPRDDAPGKVVWAVLELNGS